MEKLTTRKCTALPKGTPPLDAERVNTLATMLENQWTISDDISTISYQYKFKNYYKTIAFVNALAWIAHQEDHHPDLLVSYNKCTVTWSTHSVGGLSENDFICAAKIDALYIDE